MGPSEWDLATDNTSQKRPKPEDRQCLGVGANHQLKLGQPARCGPHLLGGTVDRAPSDPWGLSWW